MSQYRVMIVDDSAFMRKIITDLISEDSEFHVVCTAKNGIEAIEKTKEFKPDVITMDIEMPEANGLEALKVIMRENPTPTVMLSSTTSEGASETLMALELGAVDFVKKPSGAISLDLFKVKEILLDKLRIAVKTDVKKHQSISQNYVHKPIKEVMTTKELTFLSPTSLEGFQHIVVVGTSTGGPKALKEFLTQLPKSFPAPILVVQHMPPKFTKSLAERLNSLSQINVVEAVDQCLIQPGTAYIAPGGRHMTMVKAEKSNYRISLNDDEPRYGHRPSVDVLYESLIAYHELKRHVVIMTGMGSDGAKGMKSLRESGAESTIAESEETCVVYGMPRVAVELNAAQYVLPLYQIPYKLVDLINKK